MKLTINGETVDNIRAETISGLLEELKLVQGRVAVEVNLSVIKRAEHETFRLKDGDIVEIVSFVGGG